jgi:hypothetical protein
VIASRATLLCEDEVVAMLEALLGKQLDYIGKDGRSASSNAPSGAAWCGRRAGSFPTRRLSRLPTASPNPRSQHSVNASDGAPARQPEREVRRTPRPRATGARRRISMSWFDGGWHMGWMATWRILECRYARGELDQETFRRMRDELRHS